MIWGRTPLVGGVSNFVKDWLTDVYLVSFPKAGRTWLRSMLGYAIVKEYNLPETDVLDLWQLSAQVDSCRRIRITHACDPHQKAPSEISLEGRRYLGKRVLFLARDPRDLLVSLFYHETHRRPALGIADGPSSTNISEMIDRERGGLRSLIQFYHIWTSPPGVELVHLFYEDMHEDPYSCCRLALDHLGLGSLSRAAIEYGIEQSSFGRMRKREQVGAIQDTAMRRADAADPQSFKVRSGKVASYKDHFTTADLERIDAHLSRLSEPFDRYRPTRPIAG